MNEQTYCWPSIICTFGERIVRMCGYFLIKKYVSDIECILSNKIIVDIIVGLDIYEINWYLSIFNIKKKYSECDWRLQPL